MLLLSSRVRWCFVSWAVMSERRFAYFEVAQSDSFFANVKTNTP